MKKRVVDPELLDSLPDRHADAIASRDELLIINRLMGNHRWLLRRLRQYLEPGWRITEIGAGDGALGLQVIEAELCAPADLFAIDLASRPETWPPEAAWIRGDVLQQPLPETEVLMANLVLHHFQDEQLRQIGSGINAATRLILASEPARYWSYSLAGALLCNIAELHPVTRYDMQVSIRSGFRRTELPDALGLGPDWHVQTSRSLLGAYHLLAWR